MVFNRPQEGDPAKVVEAGIQWRSIFSVWKVVANGRFFMNRNSIVWIGWVNERFNVHDPQSSVIVGDVEAPVPATAVTLIGRFVGFKVSTVKVVR